VSPRVVGRHRGCGGVTEGVTGGLFLSDEINAAQRDDGLRREVYVKRLS